MHLEDEEDAEISAYYSFWPALVGLTLGAGVIYFMFALADGFA